MFTIMGWVMENWLHRLLFYPLLITVLFGVFPFGQAIGMEYLNGEDPDGNEAKIIQPKKREFKGFSFRGIKFGVPLEEQDVDVSTRHYDDSFAGPAFSVYWCANLPDIGIETSYSNLYLLDGKVESIDMTFSSESAAKLLFIMTEKYGKPSIDYYTVQNKMGAKFRKYQAFWKIKDCYVWLSNIGSKIDTGTLNIETMKYNKLRKDKERREKQKAKDNL